MIYHFFAHVNTVFKIPRKVYIITIFYGLLYHIVSMKSGIPDRLASFCPLLEKASDLYSNFASPKNIQSIIHSLAIYKMIIPFKE